jgi:hypothetical protein
MPSPLDVPKFEKGQPLSAAALQKLANGVGRQSLQPGQFQTGAFTVQRRVNVPGSGDSIRWGLATSAITARGASGDDWTAGTGTVQPMKLGGAGMTPDGEEITVTNWLPIAAEAGSTVEYEGNSLEVREFTCPDEEP